MTRLFRLTEARLAHAHVARARERALERRLDEGDVAMVIAAHPWLTPPTTPVARRIARQLLRRMQQIEAEAA